MKAVSSKEICTVQENSYYLTVFNTFLIYLPKTKTSKHTRTLPLFVFPPPHNSNSCTGSDGNFRNDDVNSRGVLQSDASSSSSSGEVYRGEWLNNKRHGVGVGDMRVRDGTTAVQSACVWNHGEYDGDEVGALAKVGAKVLSCLFVISV